MLRRSGTRCAATSDEHDDTVITPRRINAHASVHTIQASIVRKRPAARSWATARSRRAPRKTNATPPRPKPAPSATNGIAELRAAPA
jgi:hypothetical protein